MLTVSVDPQSLLPYRLHLVQQVLPPESHHSVRFLPPFRHRCCSPHRSSWITSRLSAPPKRVPRRKAPHLCNEDRDVIGRVEIEAKVSVPASDANELRESRRTEVATSVRLEARTQLQRTMVDYENQ